MQTPEEIAAKRRVRAALRNWGAPVRGAVGLGILCQLIAMSGWIAIAWGLGQAIHAIAGGEALNGGLAVAGIGALVRGLANLAADVLFARAGRTMVSLARRDLLEALPKAGAGWLGGADAGTRTSQIIDRTAKLEGYAARWLPGMQMAVAGPVLILIAVAMQSWLSAALLLVSVMVLPLFIWLTASETASRASAQQAALDNLSGTFQSRAAQSGLIRAFRAIRREAAGLRLASNDLRERTMAILRVAFLSTAVLEFFASVSIALVAVYIGFKLLGVFPFGTGETLTLAEGMTALILAPEFFAPIRKLSSLHHDRADASAAADMLSGWLVQANDQGVTRLAKLVEAPIITFDHVTLHWANGAPAVTHLRLEARPGRITILAGPSGSGKSTTLLALIGRAETSSGEIRIDGRPLQAGESLADSIAYIGQAPWLMEGTIRDNIALARPDAHADAIEAAARQAGIFDFAVKDRGGLDQPLARFGAGLSGGQRQRITLARALLRNAPVLLMDEPTAHLDPDAEAAFIEQLKALATGRTILIATHSDALMAAADEIVAFSAPGRGKAAPC